MPRLPRRLTALVAAVAGLMLATSSTLAAFPDEIDLAPNWQPEGIAAGPGTIVFVGSRQDGGVTRIDLLTGERDDDFIPSATPPAVGLEYEDGADRLWVAGGNSGEVRVYDATTGELLETYSFGSGRFVNDIVVTNEAAYATDSSNAELIVLPIEPNGALPDPADTFLLDLGGDWNQVSGFNANGIEAFRGSLLIPNSTTGQLFAVDPGTGEAAELLPAGSINAADGLLLVGSTLYVAQNASQLVSVWRIQGGTVTSLGTITDDEVPGDLDFPTTLAFVGGSLWAANARFSTTPTETTPYWITRIPL